MCYILALYYKTLNLLNDRVVLTKMTNKGIIEAFNNKGIEVYLSDVGDKNVYKMMLDNNIILGSEASGHIINLSLDILGDGVLNSFIYDIYTANCEGVKTTSNGLRGSYLTTPMISPTNLEFKFREMKDLSEISNGVLTTSVLGAHTANPISGDFSVEASNAFKIENGELSNPINKAMISGNIFEIMKTIEGIDSEIKQYGPYIIPKLLAHDLRVVGQN